MSSATQPAAPPESYVVRIYRRSPSSHCRIAGTVEIVASGTERSFTGVRELQQILGASARKASNAAIRKGGPT